MNTIKNHKMSILTVLMTVSIWGADHSTSGAHEYYVGSAEFPTGPMTPELAQALRKRNPHLQPERREEIIYAPQGTSSKPESGTEITVFADSANPTQSPYANGNLTQRGGRKPLSIDTSSTSSGSEVPTTSGGVDVFTQRITPSTAVTTNGSSSGSTSSGECPTPTSQGLPKTDNAVRKLDFEEGDESITKGRRPRKEIDEPYFFSNLMPRTVEQLEKAIEKAVLAKDVAQVNAQFAEAEGDEPQLKRTLQELDAATLQEEILRAELAILKKEVTVKSCRLPDREFNRILTEEKGVRQATSLPKQGEFFIGDMPDDPQTNKPPFEHFHIGDDEVNEDVDHGQIHGPSSNNLRGEGVIFDAGCFGWPFNFVPWSAVFQAMSSPDEYPYGTE